jgi:hypothetical protein
MISIPNGCRRLFPHRSQPLQQRLVFQPMTMAPPKVVAVLIAEYDLDASESHDDYSLAVFEQVIVYRVRGIVMSRLWAASFLLVV